MNRFLYQLALLSVLSTGGLAFVGFPRKSLQSSHATTEYNAMTRLPLSNDPQPQEEENPVTDTSGAQFAASDDLAANEQEPMISRTTRLQTIPQTRKALDPLVRSLTRLDNDSANAPTLNIPVWGELILDKSLFVLIPVAGFAIIGFFLSIYVGLNSVDAFVALEDAGKNGRRAPVETTSAEGCRGICSSQEDDLEGIRSFMSGLSK